MIKGTVTKMSVKLTDTVKYKLYFGQDFVEMNEKLGKPIHLFFTGNIYCTSCGKKTAKSFNQGFCYPCFINAPESAECIIRPELCRAHLGEGRDVEWEIQHHLQPHHVYLALSSSVKVGVTRSTQIPTRWIDQGASKCLIFATVPNRYLAGIMEVELKKYISDKTNWQRMLKNEIEERDLFQDKRELVNKLPEELVQYLKSESEITDINYPVLEFPTKVVSLSFDKTPEISGTLLGIKGQYLILDGGRVLNIRKFTGYEISLI